MVLWLIATTVSDPSFAACINTVTKDQLSLIPIPGLTAIQGLKTFPYTTPRIF